MRMGLGWILRRSKVLVGEKNGCLSILGDVESWSVD